MLGPWKRHFTAGARYSPDGRQVVFEKVHKIGRGPDSDIDGVTLSVVRLDQPRTRSARSPTRGCTPPPPTGVRTASASSTRPSPSLTTWQPDLFWIRPTGGAPTRITMSADDGGFAAEPAWLPDGTGVLFSGHLDRDLGTRSC